jgi:hypothetical protein
VAVQQTLSEISSLELKLKILQRFSGFRLGFSQRLARVLAFRTAAIAAELQGRYRRADFLWESLHEQFAGAEGPEEVRRAFALQYLLNPHWAFYRGARRQAGLVEQRWPVQLRYLCQVLKLPAVSGGEGLAEFAGECKQDVAACIERREWSNARVLATDLLPLLPDDRESQELASAAWYHGAIDELKEGKSEAEHLADAEALKAAILQLEKLQKQTPYNLLLLQRIARLHFLRAVKLGNGQRLPEALLAAERAVTYHASLKEGWEVREQLIDLMKSLQERVKELKEELAANPNKSLNDRGRQMVQDANTGFDLLNRYAESDGAKRQHEDYRVAQALSIWRELSLGEVSPDDPRPPALLGALEEIVGTPPAEEQIAPAWRQIAASREELKELNAAPIVAFLKQRLYPVEVNPVDGTAVELPEEKAEPKPAAPLLTPGLPRRWRDWEPFGYWLFAGQGRMVKIELALAMALLLAAASLTVREWSHRVRRDDAYTRMSQAAAVQDDLGTIDQAEAFLSTGVLAADSRDEEVRTAYTEALLRWVASQNPTAEIAGNHLNRYRALVPELATGGTDR